MESVIFPSTTLTIVCTSDTHNDDPRPSIPPGDIFLHAGDMTDDGTLEELTSAFNWIRSLPHKIKVIVAGNHDLGLDRDHASFSKDAYELFTSAQAKQQGIVYLDRETETIARCQQADGTLLPVKVYGNPCQPDFLKSKYAFTYLPYPDVTSQAPWKDAPGASNSVSVWVCHSPPKGILDAIPVAGLTGCQVLLQKVGSARPRLCVFGHYHSSYGKSLLHWDRGAAEDTTTDEDGALDLTAAHDQTNTSKTLFLNAAWMTMHKTKIETRNPPWVVRLKVDDMGYQ